MNIYSKKNPPEGFYVYAYIRSKDSQTAKTGTPYYIGKGKGRRAWDTDHTVKLPRLASNIIMLETNLTEVGALAIERRMIGWYGRIDNNTGILRNKTDGGEGASGRILLNKQCGEKNPSYDDTKYTFYHESGIIEYTTQYDLKTRYQLPSSNISAMIKGYQKTVKGWRITPNKPLVKLGRSHPSFKKTHVFYHLSGIIEYCNKEELCNKYDLALNKISALIRKSIKEYSGWRITKDIHIHGKVDTKLYSFVHDNGTIMKCTKEELMKKFGISRTTLNAVIRGTKGYVSAKGWRILSI